MDLNFTSKKEDRDLDLLIMDDQLDKLYQAFNNYKKEKSMDDVDPKDFMDNYFAQNNYDYLHNDAHSTMMQISRDFEAFERTESIDHLGEDVHDSSNVHPFYCPFGCYEGDGSGGSSNYNDAQSSTVMQISKDFEAFERTKLSAAAKTLVDFDDQVQLGGDVNEAERMIEEMRNANPSYNASDSSSPVIRYFFCGQTKGYSHRRKRQKRKYRGVVMSEEQRLIKMAKQKIKNREVAARTHEMRMAREAYLEAQHLELLMQNDFLKKMATFLENHKRVNVPPEPLRRTISGPILIHMELNGKKEKVTY